MRCFLGADLLNPRLQTRFGRCTKRVGARALPINLAEGSAKGLSALCRHPGGRKANGCCPLTGAPEGWARASSAHAPFLAGLKTAVSWRLVYE